MGRLKVIGMLFVLLFEFIFSSIKKVFTKISKNAPKDFKTNMSFIFILFLSITLTIHEGIESDKPQNMAKSLIKDDYPTLVCESDSGKFRTYQKDEYRVQGINEGYAVYPKKETLTPENAFNVTRCERK